MWALRLTGRRYVLYISSMCDNKHAELENTY